MADFIGCQIGPPERGKRSVASFAVIFVVVAAWDSGRQLSLSDFVSTSVTPTRPDSPAIDGAEDATNNIFDIIMLTRFIADVPPPPTTPTPCRAIVAIDAA